MSNPVRIAVCGARGRMGRETATAIAASSDFVLCGIIVRPSTATLEGIAAPAFYSLPEALAATTPQCIVDFTNAEAAIHFAEIALHAHVPFVSGTTGMTSHQLDTLRRLSEQQQTGCVIAPNFAIGAVLAMHFAAIAARYYNWSEVIELHHEKKNDAPSGTALGTAQAMLAAHAHPFEHTAASKQTLPGTRGGEFSGIHIHSIRLPGLVAHQEVLFGGTGEVLTIRHDSLARSSFMPGIFRAISWATTHPQFAYGLAPILGL